MPSSSLLSYFWSTPSQRRPYNVMVTYYTTTLALQHIHTNTITISSPKVQPLFIWHPFSNNEIISPIKIWHVLR